MRSRPANCATLSRPLRDVKYLARTPALGCGPLSARALNPVWGETGERDVCEVWCPATAGEPRAPVPPGDTTRAGHCSSGVCALCPRAVGQGATLDDS